MTASLRSHLATSEGAIVQNGAALVGTTAVTSLLGFVYWWAAARYFPVELVGLTSAVVSVMNLLGSLAVMGLGTLVIAEIGRRPSAAPTITVTSSLVAGGLGLILGGAFAIVAPALLPTFDLLRSSTVGTVLFSAGVSLAATAAVVDQACIGVLRGDLQLLRNTIFATAKVLCVIAVGWYLSITWDLFLYLTWVTGLGLSLVGIALVAARHSASYSSYTPDFRVVHKLRGSALQHHGLNLTLQSPQMILPVIVTSILSSRENAYFYIAWMFTTFIWIVPTALSIALYALGSRPGHNVQQLMKFSLCASAIWCVLGSMILWYGARLPLGLFGSTYPDISGHVVQILVVASFPMMIQSHFVALCRLAERLVMGTLLLLLAVVLQLSLAAAGGYLFDLPALATAWVIGAYVGTVPMALVLWRYLGSKAQSRSCKTRGTYARNAEH